MSNKEFALFLNLIALFLKEQKYEELLHIIEKYAGDIDAEADEKK